MSGDPMDGAVRLPGLDGSNPLGFLAALGVLRALDHLARVRRQRLPRLRWIEEGYWQPELDGQSALSIERIVADIVEDKASWGSDPALQLAYDASGEELVDLGDDTDRVIRDLKPRPTAMRSFLHRLVCQADRGTGGQEQRLALRRSLDTVGFYGSEVVQDNKGNTKPFSLHFSAGQQTFLKAIAQLQEGVGEADVREALVGPWTGGSRLPSMSWDSTVARIYALRASDPSAEKRGSNAGGDWLAFMGLGLLTAVPTGGSLRTTGVRGGWMDGVYSWPVWTPWLTRSVVRSLLSVRDLHMTSHGERAVVGLGAVFSSRITRSDQGYGGFSPAEVV